MRTDRLIESDPHPRNDEQGSDSPHRFTITSQKLSINGTCIIVNDGGPMRSLNLADVYLPPTDGCPRVVCLSDEPEYFDVALALADRRAIYSNASGDLARLISRQIYLLRHVLDWIRRQGVYRLSLAREDDLLEMMKAVAKQGWAGALRVEERWHAALDETTAEDLASAFHYYKKDGGVNHIDSLSNKFWNARIGWGGLIPLPTSVKHRIETMGVAPPSDEWIARKGLDTRPMGRDVVRNTITLINDWFCLPSTVDTLQVRLGPSATELAKDLSNSQPTRTANLGADQAIQVVTAALRMQYEVAPLLLKVFKLAKKTNEDGIFKLKASWLRQQRPVKKLAKILGMPIVGWVVSGHHPKKKGALTIEQIYGAVQSGCAIDLAVMNARRQREICDPRFGLRVGDLEILDETLGIFISEFYIEKTYMDRHFFYVNKTSADAMRCLEELKQACLPPGKEVAKGDSLFSANRRTEISWGKDSHFEFSGDAKRSRSLTSFLEIVFPQAESEPDITPHMFRRFFAILYYHRYDHAELKALSQQLRHLELPTTRVYCTDPLSRTVAEGIRAKLGSDRFQIANRKLRDALELQNSDIEETLKEVGREKLHISVQQILDGEPTGGGFSRVVGKLYAQLLSRASFDEDNEIDAAETITTRLSEHGYRVKPMPHGQCHAPESTRRLHARCEKDGELEREHAGPRTCGPCPYHYNNEAYLDNLREDLELIEADMQDYLLPPLQQKRAEFDFKNMTSLISLMEHEMERNSQRIRSLTSIGRT